MLLTDVAIFIYQTWSTAAFLYRHAFVKFTLQLLDYEPMVDAGTHQAAEAVLKNNIEVEIEILFFRYTYL